MNLKNGWALVLFSVATLLMTGCLEEVRPDLSTAEPILVIEAKAIDYPDTDQDTAFVLLSLTGDYYEEQAVPKVTNATIQVTDLEANVSYELNHLEDGLYQSVFEMKENHTYQLDITYNGKNYQAADKNVPVPAIDSLKYEYLEGQLFREDGYYIYFFGSTPKEQINYYRWLVYENDSLYNDRSDILIAEDRFVQEEIAGLEFPYRFEEKDTVKIEMYSLSEDVYIYLTEFGNLLFNDGGMFSSPPQNPPSNITNLSDPEIEPFGFFQVSSVTSEEIILNPLDD